jgi:hypothetical protein
VLYHDVLAEREPDRELYIAVQITVFNSLFEGPLGELLLRNSRVRLIVFDPLLDEVVKWVP